MRDSHSYSFVCPCLSHCLHRAINSKGKQRLFPKGGKWGFFGWHLVKASHSEIIITEGEFDAMVSIAPIISLRTFARLLHKRFRSSRRDNHFTRFPSSFLHEFTGIDDERRLLSSHCLMERHLFLQISYLDWNGAVLSLSLLICPPG